MIDFSLYEEPLPHIYSYTCKSCNTLYYPAPMICKVCDSKRDPINNKGWELSDLKGPCTLLTWTRLWNLPEGFNKKYLLFGMVQFENGLRASGRLEAESPSSGMKLFARVIAASERPGKPVMVFVFTTKENNIM